MNNKTDNAFDIIEKHIKYFPIYLGIIYAIGFLVWSTRLAFVNIYIKDFLALDYLKAGILFIFINIPLITLSIEVYRGGYKEEIHRLILAILGSAIWFMFLYGFIFSTLNESDWYLYIATWIIYPVITYYFSITSLYILKQYRNKHILAFGGQFMFAIILLTAFSNIIFPQIQFRFGGGAPYNKTLLIQESNCSKRINAKVYYENDKWIHFQQDSLIISIHKDKLIKEESSLKIRNQKEAN